MDEENKTDFYKEIKPEDSSLEQFITSLSPQKKLIGYIICGIVGLLITSWSYSLYFSTSTLGAGLAFIILNILGICCFFGSTLFLKPIRQQRQDFNKNRIRKFGFLGFCIGSLLLWISAILFGESLKEFFGVVGVILQIFGVVGYSLSYTSLGEGRLGSNEERIVDDGN